MASERPLRPKTSHFRSPVCSSHVLTPHNASLDDPEAGLGLHQLGGWHCQCNFGLRMAYPPQHLPFPTPACSSHVLTPHNASLDDPGAGLRLHQLGEGPSSGLHGNSKSDTVLDSCSIICGLFINNCCTKNCYGSKLEPNGQITVKIVLYGGTVLVRLGPYFLNRPY